MMHRVFFERGFKKSTAFKKILEHLTKPNYNNPSEVKKMRKNINKRRDTLLALSGLLSSNIEATFELFKLEIFQIEEHQQNIIGSLMSVAAKKQSYSEERRLVKSILIHNMKKQGISYVDIKNSPDDKRRFDDILKSILWPCRQIIKLS
jgi:hypothetical protein